MHHLPGLDLALDVQAGDHPGHGRGDGDLLEVVMGLGQVGLELGDAVARRLDPRLLDAAPRGRVASEAVLRNIRESIPSRCSTGWKPGSGPTTRA